jgi:uncharacterized protein YgiM (DUF1202 family)
MRKNFYLIFLALLTTGLLAQTVTNPPPPGPIETPAAAPAASNPGAAEAIAPAAAPTNAAAAKATKPAKKKAAKKKPARKTEPLRSVPLVVGPASVLASNVNVRGQAKLTSEVVTRLTKGQQVDVLEEIKLKNSGPDEPSAWAKIRLPASAHAWLNSSFLDTTTQTVKARRLNVRSGPGENYSVLGRLERGEAVKPVTSKGDWTEIEAPANAFAFVAAQYLGQEAAPNVASAPTEPVPPPTTVTEQPVVAPPPSDQPAVAAPTETAAVTNAPVPVAASPADLEPPPKRIVQREGIVRGTVSIQAPTPYALVSSDSGRTINYLYTTSKELDLGRWKGLRIIVTGEEGLDERWRNTPVITIQRIQVLDER